MGTGAGKKKKKDDPKPAERRGAQGDRRGDERRGEERRGNERRQEERRKEFCPNCGHLLSQALYCNRCKVRLIRIR